MDHWLNSWVCMQDPEEQNKLSGCCFLISAHKVADFRSVVVHFSSNLERCVEPVVLVLFSGAPHLVLATVSHTPIMNTTFHIPSWAQTVCPKLNRPPSKVQTLWCSGGTPTASHTPTWFLHQHTSFAEAWTAAGCSIQSPEGSLATWRNPSGSCCPVFSDNVLVLVGFYWSLWQHSRIQVEAVVHCLVSLFWSGSPLFPWGAIFVKAQHKTTLSSINIKQLIIFPPEMPYLWRPHCFMLML